jgi:pimeloyl-ACP methyl ester carboxylesterase
MADEQSAPPRLAERAVMAAGVKVAVAMSDTPRGQPSRLPLLLLPAAGFIWQDYRPILDALSPKRQVIALDWPGFGASERPSPESFRYGAEPFAGLVGEVMDALGIARAVALGNGIGATAAIHLAVARPVRVAGVCLMGPLGFGKPTLSGEVVGGALGKPGIMRLAMLTLLDLALGPTTTETEAIVRRIRAERKDAGASATVAAMSALWRGLTAMDAEALVALAHQVTAPALVVRGELDPLVTQAASRRATESLGTGAALEVVLPDAGHLPFIQEPARFLAALDGVLGTAEVNAASMS